jgi:allantoin racemase
VKLLWQSFLDPADHGPYVGALRSLLESATPDVEYDVVGIRPPDRHLHALTEVRCGIAALRNALWAERAGYDGIVIGHFQEPFLHELRQSVAIPVIGLGESALADACARAAKIGLVTIDEVFVPWHEEQVRRQGIPERVVGIRALGVTPDAFMAAMTAGAEREQLLAQLEAAARPLADAGAELLVSAGALPAVALCGGDEVILAGVPLQNCVAVAARAALSARRPPAFSPPPPAAIEEFLAATGGALGDPVR